LPQEDKILFSANENYDFVFLNSFALIHPAYSVKIDEEKLGATQATAKLEAQSKSRWKEDDDSQNAQFHYFTA